MANALAHFKANDPIRMAAATAFFSFFALPAIVIILSRLYGGLFDQHDQQVSLQLFDQLAQLLGNRSASELREISQHLQQRRSSPFLTGFSVVILLMASTTLFAIIKNSLNQLWQVKLVADRRWWYIFLDKAVAFGIILFTGVLVIISLALTPILSTVGKPWLSPVTFSFISRTGNHGLSILLVMMWLVVIFKYLPNIQIRWSAVLVGSAVTSLLIELGQVILNHLLINSSVRTLYGSSGDLILILLFVFYSSLIFYYGASFTRSYSEWIHQDARPGSNAIAYQIKELPD
jgi:membrane protein